MIGMSLMRSTRQISRFLQSKRLLSQGFECEESDFFRRVLLRFPPGDSNTGTWPLAFAYGSGVFKQEGNVSKNNMTDFMLVVEDSENWHSKNLEMNPKDYSGLMSLCGAKVVGELQEKFGSKCYFNTLIPYEEGRIKYGVISRNDLIADLLDWESLYVAGRLHKPVRIIHKLNKDVDAELHMALRMNLKNALHTSLLLLPEKFTEQMLYETLCGLSYHGDFRMTFGEDKNKVKRISKGSFDELKQIYAKQLSKMSEFVFMPKMSDRVIFDQDMSPGARHFHLTMLPKNMQELLVRLWNQDGKWRDVEDVLRSAAYHRDVNVLIAKCLGYVVCQPAVIQAVKGVVSAGFSKTILYSSSKVTKMLQSRHDKIQ